MHRRALVPLIALFLLLPACTPKTKPAEIFPGFESAPPDSLATIHEADSVYVQSIDNRPAPKRKFMMFTGTESAYHQYQVPAGPRHFIIYFDSGNYTASPIGFNAFLRPGHTYSFKSNADKFIVNFGTLTTGKWRPVFFDETTQAPASTQPTTAPTTSPSPP